MNPLVLKLSSLKLEGITSTSQAHWREVCTRHLNTGRSPYMLIPTEMKKVTGQWAACHKFSLVASNNSNIDVSYFISMISYLHCTDTNEKHPQVHSTLQYIYFKNIFLYKRFKKHWHVHVTKLSKPATNSVIARMLPSTVSSQSQVTIRVVNTYRF